MISEKLYRNILTVTAFKYVKFVLAEVALLNLVLTTRDCFIPVRKVDVCGRLLIINDMQKRAIWSGAKNATLARVLLLRGSFYLLPKFFIRLVQRLMSIPTCIILRRGLSGTLSFWALHSSKTVKANITFYFNNLKLPGILHKPLWIIVWDYHALLPMA